MNYYERYWSSNLKKDGFATLPPVWEESNLGRIINIIKPYCQGDVLDVGCGDGTFTSQLSKVDKVKNVIGIDLSHTAISEAKRRYPEIKFEVTSATRLPFSDESFDFITMVELAEHIIDTEQMFKEVNRVLKPEGAILITTTDFNLLKKVIVATFFWEKYFYPTNPHIRFFTKSTLEDILNKTGFKLIKYKWNGGYFGIIPKGQIVIAKKLKHID
jgi:2-polyprenyl-3-methyl-5-hydroxy-6-metoxy-1,4-benzoquinol methylase